jgi:cardiolipin hydrolase
MNSNAQDIENIATQFVEMAKDDVITTAELTKLTKDITAEKLSLDEVKSLLTVLFTKTGETLADEGDKKKVASLKKAVNHIVDNFFEAKAGISDTIFFPGEEGEGRLIKYLNMAKSTLEVCVFTISNDRIAKALENLHKKGVKVRIISDDETAKNKGSDIYDLSDKGVPVRTDDDVKAHMHNKYAIVDNRILITGSFNWTWQAVIANQENLLIIEKADLVKSYRAAFEKLWGEFKDNTA